MSKINLMLLSIFIAGIPILAQPACDVISDGGGILEEITDPAHLSGSSLGTAELEIDGERVACRITYMPMGGIGPVQENDSTGLVSTKSAAVFTFSFEDGASFTAFAEGQIREQGANSAVFTFEYFADLRHGEKMFRGVTGRLFIRGGFDAGASERMTRIETVNGQICGVSRAPYRLLKEQPPKSLNRN